MLGFRHMCKGTGLISTDADKTQLQGCYFIESRRPCCLIGDNPVHTQTPCTQLFVRVHWMLKSYDYSTENNATISKQLLILGEGSSFTFKYP